tara:strand:+ start:683 stop:943 length:261 start_codon:yes stop_codon:yes gene_type:complete
MNTFDNITYNIGKFSRYIRDKNKNCFDNLFIFYNKTSDNISKGYNNEIVIKENSYISEECLKESLINKKTDPQTHLRKSLGEISIK